MHSLQGQPLLELQEVKKVADSLNSPAEESFPLYDPSGKLYFIRSLYDANTGGSRAGQDIWFSERVGEDWSSPSNQMGRLNNAFNNGVVGVADSGRVLYLNSTYSNKLDYQVGLSKSVFEDGEWGFPRRVRIKRFNPRHDFMSFYVDVYNNAMLLSFADKNPENEDLYVSFREDNGWTKPMNLGPEINSLGSDFAPYLSEDGRIVYFTSTGHPGGPGGADIFYSRRLDDSWLRWSKPQPLPEPVNSSAFDAYFTLKGNEAFFSSNRDGEFSDLYIATYTDRKQERRPEGQPDPEAYAFSKFVGVVGGKEAAKKVVLAMNDSGDVIRDMITDRNGAFVMEGLDYNGSYILQVQNGLRDQPSVQIQDDAGNNTYLYQDIKSGNYPFNIVNGKIQAIQSATVVDVYHQGPSKFVLRGDSGLFEGLSIELTDSKGKRMERTTVAADGSFTFEDLLVNTFYTFKFESESAESAQLDYVLREGSTQLPAAIMKGALFRKEADGTFRLYMESLLASEAAAKFKMDGADELSGERVLLYNEEGELEDESFIDDQGRFAFETMKTDKQYRMALSEGNALPDGAEVHALSTDGSKTALGSEVLGGGLYTGAFLLGGKRAEQPKEQLAEVDLSTMTPVGGDTFVFGGEEKPPAGTVVYITDENDNVLDSAVVDEFGEVHFTRLPPDGNFKLKLANTEDLSMGLDRFFITDAEGSEIAFGSDGTTVKKVVGKELAANSETFVFEGDAGPPPGSVVYVIDEETGEVLDSAEVDEFGEVRFTKLPPDAKFKLQLADATDLSMGLDRFFVTDAEGKKVEFGADGKTTTGVVGKKLAASSETFVFEGDSGPPPGSVVYVIDDETGEVLDSAEVDEFGEVRFTKLPPDAKFKLQLADATDLSMGLDRFFITDAEGKKVEFGADGKSTTGVVGKKLADNSETFVFEGDSGPPPGSVVYVIDDETGEVLDSAEVDEFGEVRFTKLPKDAKFKLQLADATDMSMGLDRFFITDAEGKKVEFGADGKTTTGVVGKKLAEASETFVFDGDTGPPPGSIVYVIDDETGEVLDSAEVDEFGEVRFTKLPKDAQFKLKLADATDMSMGLDRFFVTDPEGNKVGFSPEGQTVAAIVPKKTAELRPMYKFTYNPLPVMGTWVYLLDESNYIIDSAKVDAYGRFRFQRLNPNKNYAVRLITPDGQMVTDQAFEIETSDGQIFNLPGRETNAMYFASLTQEELASQYDRFTFTEEVYPENGAKVYLIKSGERVDSTVVFKLGQFNFKKLEEGADYKIRVDDRRFPGPEATLLTDVEGEWKPVKHLLANTFRYEIDEAVNVGDTLIVDRPVERGVDEAVTTEVPIEKGTSVSPDETGSETASIGSSRQLYDRFQLKASKRPLPGTEIVLIDKATKRPIDTTYVDQEGGFAFDPMDRSKQYEIEIEGGFEEELFSVSHSDEKALTYDDGSVDIDPNELLPPSPKEYRMRLSSFDGEKAYDEVEPYPLTPPIDDENEYVNVNPDEVNKTVFDDPVKTDKTKAIVEDDGPKPSKAVASVDYGDFINKSGVAEIVETDRGWDFRFDFNKFLLTGNQLDYIHEVVIPMLRENPDMTLILEGYTDSIGTEEANYRMAVLRVSNVLYHIEMAGIEDTRVKLIPKGETNPIAPNNTPEGRALNRRVEIIKGDSVK